MAPMQSRRLAAIMALDIVGYSRLIRDDEATTLAALRHLRSEIIEPALSTHGGRAVKWLGDGLLAEFPSVVEAVAASVRIQQTMRSTPDDPLRRIQIDARIGISVGDVVVDGDDLFGDGVNIAARLQTLAEPGGIAVTSAVRQELWGKLDHVFADTGPQQLKNIAHPVHVWHWAPGGGRDIAAAAGVVISVPDRPSIAVLPFNNMSADPDQEFFGDGITEDITTALANLPGFLVIARNTTFTYKGRSVDLRQVGQELGVRYVLEGSVRKAGDQVRVTAQLIDAASGSHIWAERYDRRLDDLFAIQDEITTSVVGCIGSELMVAEHARIRRKPPQSLDAWECYVQALFLVASRSKESSARAIDLLELAVQLDPGYAEANGLLAWTLVWRAYQGWMDMASALDRGEAAIARTHQSGSHDPWPHLGEMMVALAKRQEDRGVAAVERAVTLAPNFAFAHALLGACLACAGRGDEGVRHIDYAVRLSPRDVLADDFFLHYALAHFQAGRYTEAARFAELAIHARPEHVVPHLIAAAACGQTDDHANSRRLANGLLLVMPGLTLERAEAIAVYTQASDRARLVEGLRRAGIA